MEVVDVLRAALDAVEGAGIPEDLRPLAFSTAVDLVVSGRGEAPAVATGPPPSGVVGTSSLARDPRPAPVVGSRWHRSTARLPTEGEGPEAPEALASLAPVSLASGAPAPRRAGSPSTDGEGGWEGIGRELGVRPEVLDRLWDEHGGQLHLVGGGDRLGRNRAERVGNAVLLLLAGLRWSGRDGGHPVPDALVRAEVDRLGLLDTGNYTKHLAARKAHLQLNGSGRTATYKLRFDGAEEARRLAWSLLAES